LSDAHDEARLQEQPRAVVARGARGGITTLASQAALQGIRLAGTMVLARILVPADFGVVAIVSSILVPITAIALLGLPMATLNAKRLSQPAKSTLFLVNAGLGALTSVALYLAAEPLATAYGDDRVADVARWLALSPLFSGVQAQFWAHLNREMKFGRMASIEVVSTVVGTAMGVLAALAGLGYRSIVIQVLAISGSAMIMAVFSDRWWPSRPGAWRSEVRAVMTAGQHILGMNLLRTASRSLIVPIAGLSVPTADLGSFDKAQQQAVMPIKLTVDRLQRVVVGVMVRLDGDATAQFALYRRAYLMLSYGTVALFMLVAALSEPLVRLLFGDGWELAADILGVLAIGSAARALCQSTQWVYIGIGATRSGLTYATWSQPAVVAATLVGLPGGVMGLAIANTAAWLILWPLTTTLAARTAGWDARPLLTDSIRAVLLVGLPAYAAAKVIGIAGLGTLQTVVLGALAAVACGGLLLLVFPQGRRDFRVLHRTIKLGLSSRG